MTTDKQQQQEEFLILKSILGDTITEISTEHDQFEIDIEFQLSSPFFLRLIDVNHQLSTSIQYLPPLILTVHFHDTYPSSIHSPTFVLSSCYLSREYLQSMCQILDKIWEQNLSEPIVFQWIESLKDHFLLTNELCLLTKNIEYDENNDDPRAMSNYESSRAAQIYEQLLEYNREQEDERFHREYHQCPICVTNNIFGRDMIRLYKCHHAFCRSCLHDYAQMHINTGSVQWLLCPDSQCQLALLPSEIKMIIDNNQLYEKYERLLLQKSLEQMLDIVWCPRCQQAVLTGNETDNLALCDQCRYAFCKKCKETYHSDTLCGRDLRLAEMRRKRRYMRDELQKLGITPQEEELLLQDIVAVAAIEGTTRLCPNAKCQVPIEKNGGCNHMSCTRCLQQFDWNDVPEQSTTMQMISSKFKGEIDEVQRAFDREQHVDDEEFLDDSDKDKEVQSSTITNIILKRGKKCPNIQCSKMNIKSSTSNYLICRYCKRGFCFSCGHSVLSMNHFGHACKRHSAL